jgi:hypothetical protein
MPKWWPWRGSKHPAPEPAAPAARAEPAWHRLPSIQRTVGDIEPTAQLQGFTESLTTSQNPGLTGPLEVLSAKHSDRLSVLDVVRDPAPPAAHHTPSPAAAHQSRTWAPSPMAIQRALVGSTASVQRTADVAVPVREIHPVEATSATETAPHSMVDAPPPDDARMLEVASDPELSADEPHPVGPAAAHPISDHQPAAVAETAGGTPDESAAPAADYTSSAENSTPMAVQRVPSQIEPFPAGPQTVSATSTGSTGTSLRPPFRHLPSVQRDVTQAGSTPQPLSGAHPLTVLPTIESPAAARPPDKPSTAGAPAPSSAATLQRSIEPDPARPTATPSASGPLPPPGPAVSAGELPVIPTGEAPQSATASPPVTAQRITARLQRLPVVQTHPAPAVVAAAPERRGPALPVPQRSPERMTEMVVNGDAAAEDAQNLSAGLPPHSLAKDSEAPWDAQPLPDAAAPAPAGAPAPPSGVVQRVELPVVPPTAAPARIQSSSAASDSHATLSPVVQRTATAGRLVMLPPVRGSGGSAHIGDSASSPARSVLFESPRPVGLQRMFEQHTAKRPDSATHLGVGSASASPTSATAGSYSGSPESAPPGFEASEPSYDASTNTITFSPPTVQRETEAASPSPEAAPAAAPAPAPTAAPAASGPAPGGDVDELVNRLYDPLAARLRAELWLDRERAGVLMDLGR